MANHGGVNGLQCRKHHIYTPTPAEARARGRVGGSIAGQKRKSSTKWRRVQRALDACKEGRPTWEVLADLYSDAYDLGYRAHWNRRRGSVEEPPV